MKWTSKLEVGREGGRSEGRKHGGDGMWEGGQKGGRLNVGGVGGGERGGEKVRVRSAHGGIERESHHISVSGCSSGLLKWSFIKVIKPFSRGEYRPADETTSICIWQ